MNLTIKLTQADVEAIIKRHFERVSSNAVVKSVNFHIWGESEPDWPQLPTTPAGFKVEVELE